MKKNMRIMNKTVFIGSLITILVLALILITACSSSTPEQAAAGLGPDQEQNQARIPNQYDKITESQPSAQVAEEAPAYSAEVAGLIEKSADIASYYYSYSSSIRDEYGNYDQSDDYEAQVKNNKIKKSYLEPVRLNSSTFYSEVYLDAEQETAFITCGLVTVLCEESRQKFYFIRYPAVKIRILPLEIIGNIPATAEKVSTETINGRQAIILEYVNSAGNKERLSLDSYSGFPLKQESFILEDDEEILLQRSAFNLKSFNDIKNADVNVPDNYVFG
ncbi:MAG TPA: hypothetical protein VJG49_00740 [Candidatus Nanoarchaeia archaeon]|nr:hypothetical protein [Candidatus Nanoarchaeia archaeon]